MNRTASLAALLLAGFVFTQPAQALEQAVSAEVRQYGRHHDFDERPFANGDMGYGAAYEIRDVKGSWQLGALYSPDAGGRDSVVDYAITPFLNLILRDGIFLAGLGVDKTYMVNTDGVKDDWTDLYWNLLTGLEFPLGKRLSLTGLAIYDFEGWSKLDEFRFDDVEFAAAVNYLF